MGGSGFPRVTSSEISWLFPDFFLVQFLLIFAAWKLDILMLERIHMGHTDAQIIAATIWLKISMNF